MIRGITFSEQAFYSADFAHYQNFFLNRQNGITKGCKVTREGNQITIGTGYFIAHGRLMNVEDPEIIESGFAEGYNRIVYEIDLSKENTISDFLQGYIKILNTEELVQEDLDSGGKVYQMPFCHFQFTDENISGFVIDAPTLVLDNIFSDVSANFGELNSQIEKWFAEQKSEFDIYADGKKGELDETVEKAETIIKELEADGFEKKSMYIDSQLLASNWNQESKIYNFESEYPAEQYDIHLFAGQNITTEQLEALNGALLIGRINENFYTAKGDIPDIDIPIILKVVKKYGSIS